MGRCDSGVSHGTRHTYANILIGRGESLVYVKEQMGHSSIKVTVDTYGQLIPGANKSPADRLDSILAQPDASQAQAKQNGVATDDRNPVSTLVELRGFEPLTS